MPAFSDLQTRIITETSRDDLSDTLAAQLVLHIARAIEYYADHRFWFNEAILPGVCVVGNQYAPIPTAMRTLDRVSIQVGTPFIPLTKRSLVWIDDMSTIVTNGPPTNFAVLGYQIRQWPTPNFAYPLNFVGIVNLSTLANPTDSNAWTNEAYDLTTARAKFTLYRDQFKDKDGMAGAAEAEAEALSKLTAETARRLGTGRVRSRW